LHAFDCLLHHIHIDTISTLEQRLHGQFLNGDEKSDEGIEHWTLQSDLVAIEVDAL
jgi:hypothetical protein